MPYTNIIYRKDDHIARITLNRPRANNAINQELAQELTDACQQISRDDDIYAVIITGAGEKAFCCGGGAEDATGYGVAEAVSGIPQPVIAAING